MQTQESTLRGYKLEPLTEGSIQAAFDLEALSFPADEAASLEAITSRQRTAGMFFYGLYRNDEELLGFVNGTCTSGEELHHDTMSRHDAQGRTLCVHSVVMHPDLRRQGLATAMLRSYVKMVLATTDVDLILLICKAYLIGFYQRCGFEFVRASPVAHGKESWFELRTDRIRARRKREVLQVDAFTAEPLGGNPAAVVFAEAEDEPQWMQTWGAEINLSETAFVVARPPQEQSSDPTQPYRYGLRWFTPAIEVDLCGHATLASAHALWESRRVDKDRAIAFETKSGVLTATREAGGWISLDFPSVPPRPIEKASEFHTILRAYGCAEEDVIYLGRNIYDVFVVLTASAFERNPDIGVLNDIDCRGVIATRAGLDTERWDFVSRCFFPRAGIPEDPVTGSAHCCLGPYWSQVLGKTDLQAFQASKRGGVVRMVVYKDTGRVKLTGQAALVKAGCLCC